MCILNLWAAAACHESYAWNSGMECARGDKQDLLEAFERLASSMAAISAAVSRCRSASSAKFGTINAPRAFWSCPSNMTWSTKGEVRIASCTRNQSDEIQATPTWKYHGLQFTHRERERGTHTHTHTRACGVRARVRAHVCARERESASERVHTCVCVCARTRSHTRACACTRARACAHTHRPRWGLEPGGGDAAVLSSGICASGWDKCGRWCSPPDEGPSDKSGGRAMSKAETRAPENSLPHSLTHALTHSLTHARNRFRYGATAGMGGSNENKLTHPYPRTHTPTHTKPSREVGAKHLIALCYQSIYLKIHYKRVHDGPSEAYQRTAACACNIRTRAREDTHREGVKIAKGSF